MKLDLAKQGQSLELAVPEDAEEQLHCPLCGGLLLVMYGQAKKMFFAWHPLDTRMERECLLKRNYCGFGRSVNRGEVLAKAREELGQFQV